MKNMFKYIAGIMAIAFAGLLNSCGEFTPTGYEEVATLPGITSIKAETSGHVVNLSWTLPVADSENPITGVLLLTDGDLSKAKNLPAGTTSYTVLGQPLGVDVTYSVKVVYSDNRVSLGKSVVTQLPAEDFAAASDVKATVNNRTVTLSWKLPAAEGITGVRVSCNGESAQVLEGKPTSHVFKSQPMEEELVYSVEVMYDTYYASAPALLATPVKIAYIEPKIGYLMTAATPADLPDDDERAAARWFAAQPNCEFITPERLVDLDTDIYTVLWVEIDRVGLPLGWENLPQAFVNETTLNALRNYAANGGNLYLANMATQLTVPLSIVPDNMAPTVYGNGDGGSGDDVWVINPYLGWQFKDGGDQGFYDRTAHAIYKGLTFEDPNDYGYLNLPLIGPGQREDHNCLWDCNIYGRGNQADVIKNFEITTGSLVLATWGHVRDHCVAGLVEFYPVAGVHGRCIANGLAAYEWNQNSGANPYQGNIEKLTSNILEYLRK